MKAIVKLSDKSNAFLKDFGILVGRLGLGLSIALAHGLGQMQNFSMVAEKFPDPLGIGSTASLALAVFAELFCGLLLVIGAGTRLAVSQLMVSMGVAIYCHMKLWGDPLFPAKPGDSSAELAFIYLIGFTVLLFTGPGRFSIDHLIVKKWGK